MYTFIENTDFNFLNNLKYIYERNLFECVKTHTVFSIN